MYLSDAFNFYLSILGSMSMFFAKPFSPLHFKSNYLISFYKIINDLCFYNCCYVIANKKFAVIINQQYFIEFNFVSGLTLYMRNVQVLTFLYFKLLTCYFYNC